MGSIYYHGTSEENAKLILKEGFKPYTYFTWNLHASLTMGGMWIFAIYFEDKSTEKDYWEWRNKEVILPDKIMWLRKFDIDLIYDNEKEQERVRFIWHKERNGDGIIHCENCKGMGQMNEIPVYRKGKNHDNGCDVCEICKGKGFLRK